MEGGRAAKSVREEAQELLRTAEKASELTRQLLTFSRQQILDRSVVNVNEVIRSYKDLVGRIFPISVACRLDLEPDLEPVEISRNQLEQMLLNLIVNARDALKGEPQGTVVVRTRNVLLDGELAGFDLEVSSGRYVRFQVQDTGCGMDEATKERIFEPFFTTKRKERGSGMGLAAVHGIVAQAGGAIEVESEPGEGSTFTIYLPVAGARRGSVEEGSAAELPTT